MAHWDECLTLTFGSGLMAGPGIEPCMGLCAECGACLGSSLSLSLSLPLHTLSL